jgi:predicted nuclease of restriction endonuclease-like (RecB) superfamily
LQRFKKFFLLFPVLSKNDNAVVAIQHLGRSHIERIMHLKDANEQKFFFIEASKEKWSVKELDRQINSALYHRLALSKDKDKVMALAKEGEIVQTAQDILRNPYVLEFL